MFHLIFSPARRIGLLLTTIFIDLFTQPFAKILINLLILMNNKILQKQQVPFTKKTYF